MKQLVTVIFCFAIVIDGQSQSSHRFGIEGGPLYNKPLRSTAHFTGPPGNTTSVDWNYDFYNSTGYQTKATYELKLAGKKSWTIYFPFGISYLQQVDEYKRDGYTWGCFGGMEANEVIKTQTSMAGCLAGISVNYSPGKFRYSAAIISNNLYAFKSHISTSPLPGSPSNPEVVNSYTKQKYKYLSGELSVMYQMRGRLSIGALCEVYCYDLAKLTRAFSKISGQASREKFSLTLPYAGKNIWVSPGLKLQFDL